MSKQEHRFYWKRIFRKIVRKFHKLKQIIRESESWIERKIARLAFLILMALLGLFAGQKISSYTAQVFCLSDNLKGYFEPFAVSVFVVIALWFFRTYDTRQKIYQDDLFKGLDNLASSNPLQVDIGVAMLREISKKVPSFNEIIKVAFIRRLKNMPGDHEHKDGNFLSYAQHIMQWLIRYKKENQHVNFNLNGLDLSYQEFTSGINGKEINFKEFFCHASDDYRRTKYFSLYYADVSGIDFSDLCVTSLASGSHVEFYSDPIEMINRLQDVDAKKLMAVPTDFFQRLPI